MKTYKDWTVISQTGETGTATGSVRKCPMDGCNGQRVSTKWADGKTTFPCTKGMEINDKEKTLTIL